MLQPFLVLNTVKEALEWRASVSLGDKKLGFVPTMGALHDGHSELLRTAKKNSDFVVLSIFVNPNQFSEGEDFEQYPVALDRDLKIAEECGVDVVFLPSKLDIYPENYSTFVKELVLSEPLCGEFRSGHFSGVATVLIKFFNIIQPHCAYFGLKDAQQFFVVSKIVKDLNLNLHLEGIPTVREKDGLALSSRNIYLSDKDRELAPRIYEELQKIKEKIFLDKTSSSSILRVLTSSVFTLERIGFQVQYLKLLKLPYLERVENISIGNTYLLAIAVYLGNTRLIDNIIIEYI